MKNVMIAANLLIALNYVLIGSFFLGRVRAHLKDSAPKTLVAYLSLGVFFLGCVHTHLDLVFMGVDDPHWLHPGNIVSHILQGIGGFVFWVLARKYLVINIFDRKAYDRIVEDSRQTEARLAYLAMKAGLVR